MKKLLCGLLTAALLCSLAITAGAVTVTDDEIPSEASTADEGAGKNPSETLPADEEVENTDPDITTAPGSKSSAKVKIVPSRSDLPEGYVVDESFSITFTLDAEHDWRDSLDDLLAELEDDEYIYFIEEENVPDGYTPEYSDGTASGGSSTGKVIVVKNVKEGKPPIYELPQSGGIGTTPYTAAGAAILLTAAAYCMILRHKRKKSA